MMEKQEACATLFGAYSTDSPPMHGSFVRASTAALVAGGTFLDALRDKYQGSRTPIASLRTASLTGAAPPPALPSASDVDVATAGEDGDIADACPALRSVDLSRSLIPSWHEATRIARQPPLSDLVLQYVTADSETRLEYAPSVALPQLTHLGVNAAASWADIVRIAPTLPALMSLDAAGNCITELTPPELHSLTTLNLGSNMIDSWADVCEALGRLPALERLVLTDNRISHIPPPPIHHTFFPRLVSISLIGNPITAWSDLEALEQWVHGELKLSIGAGSFFDKLDERAARAETIGRLGSLSALNHTQVTPPERTESERYYVHLARERPDTRVEHLAKVHEITLHAPRQRATLDQKNASVRVAALSHQLGEEDAQSLLVADHPHVSLLRTMPLRLALRRIALACGIATHEAADAQLFGILQPAEPGNPLVTPLDVSRTLDWYGVRDDDVLVLLVEP